MEEKYELIKEYPLVRKPCIVKKDSNGKYVEQNGFTCTVRVFCKEEIENFPEFWQEVKEPLFVTEDGVKVYNPKQILFKVVNTNTSFAGWVNYIPCNTAHSSTEKIFSTMESAEQWIDQNKPVFSKKQVLDALRVQMDELTYAHEVRTKLMKELGL